jgi:hypothetical protein
MHLPIIRLPAETVEGRIADGKWTRGKGERMAMSIAMFHVKR